MTTDWVVGSGWIDGSGRRLSSAEEAAIVRQVYGDAPSAYGPGSPLERYLAEHGLKHYVEYHPDSVFWSMQAIEAACFLGFAAVLVVATALVVRRR